MRLFFISEVTVNVTAQLRCTFSECKNDFSLTTKYPV
jgi:hypothetical protein